MNIISAGIQSIPPIHFQDINNYMGCITITIDGNEKVFDNFIPLISVMVGCQEEDVLFDLGSNILNEIKEDMISNHFYPEGAKSIVIIRNDKKELIVVLESTEKCL